MNLWVIFLTGLTVGGLTCLAVQGGLLTSVVTAREEGVHTRTKTHALWATGAFLLAKLASYTLLGFILGAFGGALNIGGTVQTFMQLAAGLYMVFVALNLLNIHSIFRYVIIQPPRSLVRLVRNQSKSKDLFAPALLGAMTVFIPCGTTLAMETLAISSANPFIGASIMLAFTLGTMPLFFGIGVVTSLLGDAFKTTFLKLAAVAVMYLGLSSINGALVAFGSPLSFQSIGSSLASIFSPKVTESTEETKNYTEIPTSQNVQILITNSGYSPSYFRVKKGEPVHLTLANQGAYSCAAAFRIPSYGITATVRPNQSEQFTFTPTKPGKVLFTCSMGMYQGIIDVI